MKSLSKLIEKGNREAISRWTSGTNVITKDGVVVSNVAKEEKFKEQFLNGYEKGFEQGEQEGKAAGIKALQDQATNLSKILNNISSPFSDLEEQAENEFLALAMSLAKQIVRREIETNPETILPVVRDALSMLASNAQNISILLNPEDAKVLKENTDMEDSDIKYKIVEDNRILRGGCKVKSDNSIVDASIEKQFEKLSAQVIGDDNGTE